MFHVFEHFTDPIKELIDIKGKMQKGGKLFVEVPHANDFLISFAKLDEFKAFTFFSEHLILHTRSSLKVFLKKAGFSNIHIFGVQRYPLANHLHWLIKKAPNGHIIWNHLRNANIDKAYSELLSDFDMTDTLVAIAEK